jgi:phospholipid transport system transporter-binding protein
MSQVFLNKQSASKYLLSGELTRHSVGSIQLPTHGEMDSVTLDLSELSLIDTAGLAWLIHTLGQLQRKRISLRLINLPQQLIKLMKLGHVENLFE